MVAGAQNLLKLVQEVKLSAFANDHEGKDAQVAKRTQAYAQQAQGLAKVRDELQETVADIDSELASSKKIRIEDHAEEVQQ